MFCVCILVYFYPSLLYTDDNGGDRMKFCVGYQLLEDDRFMKEIITRKEHIYEVYFSWGSFPNGRNDQTKSAGFTPWEAQAKQQKDLALLAKEGIKFNLLFNGNCYGGGAQSRALFERIGETVDFVGTRYGLSSVTTTSPLIAKFIKENFEGIDVRASVNMGIGTVSGMEYVADYFDSFYIQREKNRDLTALKELQQWCHAVGKEIYLLANSGCLNNCSAHTFHDNLVSHESEAAQMDNGYDFRGICHEHLAKEGKRGDILTRTSYIRPEDIHLYEGITPAVKLATRVNRNPIQILRAYIVRQSYPGNLPELLEPNHAGLFYPYVLENSRIQSEVVNDQLVYKNAEDAFIKLEDGIYVDK